MGTRGDVQPYVALGKGLAAAGHDIWICTSKKFEGFITEYGLGYVFLDDGLLDFMQTDLGKAAMENTSSVFEAVKTALKISSIVRPIQENHLRQRWEALQEVRPDLVLFHPKATVMADLAGRFDIPCIIGFYLPLLVSTAEFPAPGVPNWKLGSWYNRLSYGVIGKAMASGGSKMINEWRAEQGLPKRGRRPFLRMPSGVVIPVLHAYSEAVMPTPSDWPETAAATGYWFLDRLDEWRPPTELEDFLASGEPPVYFGFGSIFGRDPERLTRVVLEAVEGTAVRAILAGGWGGLDTRNLTLPANVLPIEGAPHDWLFPRVAAVVHHGGCGTTAAGLRAGKPTIICPFFGDQPFWGGRVQALGAGPVPIPQKRLTADKLAAAIRLCLSDPTIGNRAAELGERIRGEDGVGVAVRWIERWWSHRRQA